MAEQKRSRRDMEAQLFEKALKDDAFRAALIDDPRGTMQRELGLNIPAGVNVTVLQESPNQLYLVVPPKPVGDRRELSEAELAAVSGGFDNTWSYVSPCTIDECFC